jgi:hypothetical protein
LKERQAEIAAQIDQHQHGDGEYRTTLESLISLASRAAKLFERSKRLERISGLSDDATSQAEAWTTVGA